MKSGERHKILVVDDEREACSILQEFFRRFGYQVITATEGGTALNLVRQEQPQLVLLDIKMSGMSGIEVLKLLREEQPACRVVIVTAVKDDAVWNEAKQYGANGYLTKPFNLEELSALVKEQLEAFDRGSSSKRVRYT